jgi:hypothetical protein
MGCRVENRWASLSSASPGANRRSSGSSAAGAMSALWRWAGGVRDGFAVSDRDSGAAGGADRVSHSGGVLPTPDETGWKVGGQLCWMWVFSTAQVTVYAIEPGRGFEQAARELGADFAGFLVRDGWAVYRRFLYAMHQSCLAHLLRRCREMLVGGEAGNGISTPDPSHFATSYPTARSSSARTMSHGQSREETSATDTRLRTSRLTSDVCGSSLQLLG